MTRIRFALRAGAWHLLASSIVATLAAMAVFLFWYPAPFASIAGGTSLFVVLVFVDVVVGPALTTMVATPTKPTAELRRDIGLIVVMQLIAFAYGMYSIALARPVLVSFEVDRFRLVTAADIDTSELPQAQAEYRQLSWSGPKLVASVKATRRDELVRSVESALAGRDISMFPRNWQSYDVQRKEALLAARPVSSLLAKYPDAGRDIAKIAAGATRPIEMLKFLPVQARRASWVAIISEPDAEVIGYLPLDGFF